MHIHTHAHTHAFMVYECIFKIVHFLHTLIQKSISSSRNTKFEVSFVIISLAFKSVWLAQVINRPSNLLSDWLIVRPFIVPSVHPRDFIQGKHWMNRRTFCVLTYPDPFQNSLGFGHSVRWEWLEGIVQVMCIFCRGSVVLRFNPNTALFQWINNLTMGHFQKYVTLLRFVTT